MPASLLLVAALFPAAAQSPKADPVRTTVAEALPGVEIPPGRLGDSLSKLAPGQRRAVIEALLRKEGELAGNPAGLRSLADAYLGAGNPGRALTVAEGLLAAAPRDGAAQTLKGRALEDLGRKPEAAKAYEAALRADPQDKVASSRLNLLRQETGGANPTGAPSSPPTEAPLHRGLTSADLNLISSMFRTQGQSNTLARTLKKAARGDASGIEALRAQRIDVARGQPDQKELIAVREEDGMQVAYFHPSILDNPDKSRATAGLANGVEQATTQRDHSGISLWLRNWGGRLVGVLVYIELKPQEKSAAATRLDDRKLMSDRIAYQSYGLPGFPNMPEPGLAPRFLQANRSAPAGANAATVFLYFCAEKPGEAPSPAEFSGSDSKYYRSTSGASN